MQFLIKIACLVAFTIILSACQSFKSASINNPDNKNTKAARINTQLAIAYLERHDILRAKQKLMMAMQEAPQLPETWYTMGYFLETTGNPDTAKQHYLKAIELAPKRGDTHNNYGTFLCRNGHSKEAIQHFLLAVKDPAYLDPASAYENAALCALKIEDPVMAERYFKKALLENPNRPKTLIALAQLNYQTGNYLAAQSNLHRFLKLSSPNSQSMQLMDKIYAKL